VTSAGGEQEAVQRRRNWAEIAQTLTAFVAVPVALLYPVGLVALFAQFVNYFFLDFYTAWYAASLVNRMVAIEQGVTILGFALVASVVLSAIFAQIFLKHRDLYLLHKSRGTSRLKRIAVERSSRRAALRSLRTKWIKWFARHPLLHWGMLITKLVLLSAAILVSYIAYSRIVAGGRLTLFVLRGRLSTECNPEKVRWHQLNLLPDSLLPASIFTAGCLVGGWLIYISYQTYRQRTYTDRHLYPATERNLGLAILKGVTDGWALSGLAIAYAGSVLASIVLAWYTPAFVPFMSYGDSVIHHGKPRPTDNAFLSYTEGQWYFLHRIQKDRVDDPDQWVRPDFTIVSLADGEVKHVRVRPNPPKASRVAPLLGVFGMKPLEENPCKSKADSQGGWMSHLWTYLKTI
jgi:hypothetical protein